MREREAAEAKQRAKELLRSGHFGGFSARKGQVLDPIPVVAPNGVMHSWLVPVALEDTMLGFFELLPNMTMTRYSSFQRDPSSLKGCPPVAAWTDPDAVLRAARPHLRPGETARTPVLSYDGAPARLAWAIEVVAANGSRRVIYVAGAAVWSTEDSRRGSETESFGGIAPPGWGNHT